MNEITLIRPDDWHCHLRDESYLARTVPDIVTQFARAIVMPNTNPPIATLDAAEDYLKRIEQYVPTSSSFKPLMTLYLTTDLSADEIMAAARSGVITACKLYPAGSTTNSDAGIHDLLRIYPLFEAMQQAKLPLLIHGEVTDSHVDIFDRETVFIEETLAPLLKAFPTLRMVFEHISTKAAVDFVTDGPKNLAATITPHHLLLNRNQILVGGINPHHYCLPVIKSGSDQAALVQAATSGNPKFFLGTDSAPHTKTNKECGCGAAGIYNTPVALAIYADIFEAQNALEKLENFASRFGAEFYQLPINSDTITLINEPWQVANSMAFGNDQVIPLMAGETLHWQVRT